MLAAIRALPEIHRDVLVATYVAGLTYSEAAAALGVKRGTVMSRVFRARDGAGRGARRRDLSQLRTERVPSVLRRPSRARCGCTVLACSSARVNAARRRRRPRRTALTAIYAVNAVTSRLESEPRAALTGSSRASRRARTASSSGGSCIELGLRAAAIDHRVRAGRLIVLYRGVYAVGHEALTQRGRLRAGADRRRTDRRAEPPDRRGALEAHPLDAAVRRGHRHATGDRGADPGSSIHATTAAARRPDRRLAPRHCAVEDAGRPGRLAATSSGCAPRRSCSSSSRRSSSTPPASSTRPGRPDPLARSSACSAPRSARPACRRRSTGYEIGRVHRRLRLAGGARDRRDRRMGLPRPPRARSRTTARATPTSRRAAGSSSASPGAGCGTSRCS